MIDRGAKTFFKVHVSIVERLCTWSAFDLSDVIENRGVAEGRGKTLDPRSKKTVSSSRLITVLASKQRACFVISKAAERPGQGSVAIVKARLAL